MKYKKTILACGVVLTLLVAILIAIGISEPLLFKAIKAKYKSTDHFLTLTEDPRIRFEKGAENNAIVMKHVLKESKTTVESILGVPFKKPIDVYICSSQESFNEYVFLSKNAPGAVYWGNVFLSPVAFSSGPPYNLTEHELTHYLFYTYLGEKAHINNIPIWFREGIAVFVANDGAKYTSEASLYTLMSKEERTAYLSGNVDFWFNSRNPRDAVNSSGNVSWLLYRVGALFVHFMRDLQPDQFNELVQLLLSGEKLNPAIQQSYGQGVESLLLKFTDYLQANDTQ